MGNAWTRLVVEASKHGGPGALRSHYINSGFRKGSLAGALVSLAVVGGAWAWSKTGSPSSPRAEHPDTTTTNEDGEQVNENLSQNEQDELVRETVSQLDGGDPDIDSVMERLDTHHRNELEQEIRSFANNAVGSDHWDSDD